MTLLDGRYKLAETIGTGGMSNVYAAEDTFLGRSVAVKMLKVDMARDGSFRERFRREAQNSARLNHPNIVAVFDTGETLVDDVAVPYIVMERVFGRTLRSIVREDGPRTPEQAAELLIPVCHALQASHEAGIIHRDIKPANIMVTNTGAVKVMDFGIARALDDSTSAMTQTAAVIGTAQYLSPEQARGKVADARSDVYAVGCVLYETVTGDVPFAGESPFAVAYQHVQEEAEAPSSRMNVHGLSQTEALNIDAVVLTAMAKHPGDRYQSAQELSEDLERLKRGAVTNAARSHVSTAPGAPLNAPTQVAPVRVAPAQTGAMNSVPASAFIAANEPTGPGRRRGRRRKETNSAVKWLVGILGVLVVIALALVGWNVAGDRMSLPGIGGNSDSAHDMIEVPDVTGLPKATARRELEKAGLVVQETTAPSPDVPKDYVVGVNPTPGSQLREGTTVTITISTGQEMTDVPDLKGMTPSEATEVLKKLGLSLNPEVEEAEDDDIESGSIVRQTPAAGTELARGSEISITVSQGPARIRVPSLTGMNASDAESTLQSLGFRTRTDSVDSRRPLGEVVAVGGSGQEAPRGSEIVLQVSNNKLIEMPNITRLSPEDAVTTLRSAGWEGSRSNIIIDSNRPGTASLVDDGLIAGTDPEPGHDLRKDATVRVYQWQFRLDAITG